MNKFAVLGALALLSLLLIPMVAPGTGEWGGADGAGLAKVTEYQPNYEPWFQPVWAPPSGEIESVLFSLQAAIGGAIIGYYVRGSPQQG